MLFHRTSAISVPVRFRQMSFWEVRTCNPTNGWNFNWQDPFRKGYQVYSLSVLGTSTIQGLIALRTSRDHGAIVLDIVEAAPHNVGRAGSYDWVGENLFAFAGILSFEMGFEGYLFLTAKSAMVEYYFNLGARLIRERDFVFTTSPVQQLIKNFIGGDDIVRNE